MTVCGTASRDLPVDPDALFETLVNPRKLPEWNQAITRVLDSPATLEPGDEWVVEMSALAQRWPSRSRVKVLDHTTRRFEYASQSDDGNPSYATWSWVVSETRGGSTVSVSWQLNPETFWRRALLVRVRQHQLMKSEVPASLAALGAAVSEPSTDAE